MATIRELKRRIKSVKNISQVTKAMQMVAASKMRRSQEQVLASRPYAAKAWEILTHLNEQAGNVEILHPLLTERETVNQIAIIMMTADRGLAGAFNANMIRTTVRFMNEKGRENAPLITIGRKGRDFMVRYQRNVVAEFADIPDRVSEADISPVARLVLDGFLEGDYDEVYLAYTDFINTLTQEPTIRPLLPIRAEGIESKVMGDYLNPEAEVAQTEYIYEPDPVALLDRLLPDFTQLQIYQAMLESKASEHSARMVAMRNATDNANELIEDLTLTYNKARQEAITKEMLDIVGGAEALEQT